MSEDCLAGDIVLTRGVSWLSKSIRKLTRNNSEEKTRVNHVGMITVPGQINNCKIIEALSKVVEHTLCSEYADTKQQVMIYRPLYLSAEQRTALVREARSFKGKKYGYLKIVTHAADYLLGGRFFFRRIAQLDDYPICSWLVAEVFFRACAEEFGVDAGAAQPDDIDDWCTANPEKYKLVRELSVVKSTD